MDGGQMFWKEVIGRQRQILHGKYPRLFVQKGVATNENQSPWIEFAPVPTRIKAWASEEPILLLGRDFLQSICKYHIRLGKWEYPPRLDLDADQCYDNQGNTLVQGANS